MRWFLHTMTGNQEDGDGHPERNCPILGRGEAQVKSIQEQDAKLSARRVAKQASMEQVSWTGKLAAVTHLAFALHSPSSTHTQDERGYEPPSFVYVNSLRLDVRYEPEA
jgi:hypothetical protein